MFLVVQTMISSALIVFEKQHILPFTMKRAEDTGVEPSPLDTTFSFLEFRLGLPWLGNSVSLGIVLSSDKSPPVTRCFIYKLEYTWPLYWTIRKARLRDTCFYTVLGAELLCLLIHRTRKHEGCLRLLWPQGHCLHMRPGVRGEGGPLCPLWSFGGQKTRLGH